MTDLELKVANIAINDHTALVANKKCYDPEDIAWEVRFCQGECGREECDNNFLLPTLDGGNDDVEMVVINFGIMRTWNFWI